MVQRLILLGIVIKRNIHYSDLNNEYVTNLSILSLYLHVLFTHSCNAVSSVMCNVILAWNRIMELVGGDHRLAFYGPRVVSNLFQGEVLNNEISDDFPSPI